MSFCKIAVLKHFEILTREQRCRGLFFNKAASFRPAPLFKRVSNTFVFSEFCKNFRNNFFMKLLTRTAKLERFCAFLSKLCSNQPICCQLSYKRLFIWRWAGPVRWAGSPKWDLTFLKGCVCYIFASLFCMSNRKYFRNKEKCFLFHFENSSCSWDNQILAF